jgi:predicted acetyltransferase
MHVKLIKPKVELQKEYMDMIHEWKAFENKLVPWVLDFDASDFPALIKNLENCSKGINLPEGLVEHSTYWLVNENNRVLGAVNIRHRLSEWLLNFAGHIGYGVRPSERRKGYASEALSQALQIAKSMEIDRALVVCDRDNIASARTIMKNGGVLENEIEKDGVLMQRYWIDIK